MSNIKLFEHKQIRSHWDAEEEQWYLSIIDVIQVLTESSNPRDYWFKMKVRVKTEDGLELSTNCRQLKMKATDGKVRETDVAETQVLLRIIQSIPSPKAEPFKQWLAKVGYERMQETVDPEKTIDRAMRTYLKKGYSREWINQRLKSIEIRKELTDEWSERGMQKTDYGILTDEITKAWSGKTTREYKEYKGLKSQNLRDNMTNLELVLNMLGEISTSQISSLEKPVGIKNNKKVASRGGTVAKKARLEIEKQTGQSVISSQNSQNPAQLK